MNVNAPEFCPGNVKNQRKNGCNVFAKAFFTKYGVDGNKTNFHCTANMVKKFTENSNIVNSKDSNDEICNENIKALNNVETLDRHITNAKSCTGTTLSESTPVLNKCVIYNHTGSTTVKINDTVLKNNSSTSRPCDTVDNYQHNTRIYHTILNNNSSYTWLPSTSTGNINTERPGRNVDNISLNPNTSTQECSSLYMWLAGESDQKNTVSGNVHMQNSSALQSISCYVESLQDIYIENNSLTVTNPHNTTMYTSNCTVYTTISNSGSQNSIVKCKKSTHKGFTPAVIASKGMTSNTACILKGGYFSDFKYKTNVNNSQKYSCITWEAESMNFTQFHTEEPYVREFGFLPLEMIRIKIQQNNEVLQEPDMCRWIHIAQEQVERSKDCNYQRGRIPVPSGLNIYNWRNYLKHYDFQILCEYLQFGFPLGIDYHLLQFNNHVTNHPSAFQYSQGVDQYFKEEVGFKAMVGPMSERPFAIHYSPLMARNKPDEECRFILAYRF